MKVTGQRRESVGGTWN